MTDIWCTGIILYAMLCGYFPFEEPNSEVLFQKILKCDVQFPEYLSDEAIDLMKKILVANPKKRITITRIKNHPFYLKGKEKFKSLYPNLVSEVEKYYRINKNKDNKIINEKVTKIKNNEIDIYKIMNNQKKNINKKEKENKNKLIVNSEAIHNGININDNIVKKIRQKKEINNILKPKKSIENINNKSDIQKLRNKSKEKEKYNKIMNIIENNENTINSRRNQGKVMLYNIKFVNNNIKKQTKITANLNNINSNKNTNLIMKDIKPSKNRITERNNNKSDIQAKTMNNYFADFKRININKNISKNKNIELNEHEILHKKSFCLSIKKNEIFKRKIIGPKTAKKSNNNDNIVLE